MSYTPRFQAILDKCKEMKSLSGADSDIQLYFKTAVRELGDYERLNNLYRIRPKRPVIGEPSRFQFFRMNKMQETYFKAQSNRDLILKMRQGGVTTLSCLKALDKCLWEDGVHTAIMAHVRERVKDIFVIIKDAFLQFQKDWGRLYPVSRVVDNINEIRIKETGSDVKVCTETKGLTLDLLHISEACFVEDSRISESIESVPLSGQVIMESTPNTATGLFYKMWDMFERKKNCTFKGHFFSWWYHYPEEEDLSTLIADGHLVYTDHETILLEQFDLNEKHILWRRVKIAECGGDVSEFQRKYPEDPMTCFLSGSNRVFPMRIIANLLKKEKEPPFTGDLALCA